MFKRFGPDAAQLAGGAILFMGVWDVFPPAAFVLAGIGLILYGEGLGRR